MSAWLGVVSRDHVLRGVSLGIGQVNHGKKPPLDRMTAGDILIYYSPRTTYPDGEPLRAFTAFGSIADEPPFQADEGTWQPWRRRVAWSARAAETPIRPLIGELEFTRGENWGYALRRGLLPVSEHDAAIIRRAMGA